MCYMYEKIECKIECKIISLNCKNNHTTENYIKKKNYIC